MNKMLFLYNMDQALELGRVDSIFNFFQFQVPVMFPKAINKINEKLAFVFANNQHLIMPSML